MKRKELDNAKESEKNDWKKFNTKANNKRMKGIKKVAVSGAAPDGPSGGVKRDPKEELGRIDFPAGVHRFKFAEQGALLYAALSDGSLAEISLKDRSLKSKTQITTEGDDVGRMILDVSPSGDYVAVSHGDGQLSLLDGSTKAIIRSWKGHHSRYTENCEVWSCAHVDSNTLASGGEDAHFCLWDTRTTDRISRIKVSTDGSGCTFVGPSSDGGNDSQVLTGSYDQFIRVYDQRNPSQAVNERMLAGGVWNIEQHPECMVVSCMYGGWAMLDRILEPFYCERKPGDALLYGATICDQGLRILPSKTRR
ncbi:unnamed protein product, partial [Mesorhabditis spiculigera]